MRVGAQTRRRGFLWARQAWQTQHLLACPWPKRDPVGARGCLQGQKRTFPIRFGEVGLALLCGQQPWTPRPCSHLAFITFRFGLTADHL